MDAERSQCCDGEGAMAKADGADGLIELICLVEIHLQGTP
jgi:hypothetical protein